MWRFQRFQQSVLFVLVSSAFYTANFILVLLLAIVTSRITVLGIQYLGGNAISLVPGLEAWIVIEVLIILTHITERGLKIKLRGSKFRPLRRLIKKLATAKLVIGIFQFLIVIGTIVGIFFCYKGSHETKTSPSLNSTDEVKFNDGPVSISNFLNPIRLYANLFIIFYGICVYICTADTKLSFLIRRKVITNSIYRRSNWRSQASFAGYLAANFLQLLGFSLFFYYTTFGVTKFIQNPGFTFLVVCTIAVGVGLGFEALRDFRKIFEEELLKPPWFKLENQLCSEYLLHLYLVLPSVALVFYKNIAQSQSLDNSNAFYEFVTILSLAIFSQTKYLVMEFYLNGQIQRAEERFGHANRSEFRRRRGRIARRTRNLRGRLDYLAGNDGDSDRGRRRSHSVESQNQSSDRRQENRPTLKPSTNPNIINNNPTI